eukprot:gene4914-6125_t
MDLKRKFDGSSSTPTITSSLQLRKLVVKNVPKLNRSEITNILYTLINRNPKATISVPTAVPSDLTSSIPENTTIAFISSTDISQLPILKNILNGKLIKENKIQVDFYDLKKPTPLPPPPPTSTPTPPPIAPTKNNNTNNNNNKSNDSEKIVKKQKVENKDQQQQQQQQQKVDNENNEPKKKQKQHEQNKEKEKEVKVVVEEKGENKEVEKDIKEDKEKEENKEKETNKSKNKKNKEPKEIKVREPTVRNNRAVVNKITQQISNYSENKEFRQLMKSYNYLKKVGAKPDHITYGIMLNACVRCQEYDVARQVFKDAVESELGANEVVYTTFIKALVEVNMEEAKDMLFKMKESVKVQPNIRTYNSILRGCVRNGDINIAKTLFNDILNSGIDYDSTTIEYIIKIYCQHLSINEVWELLGKVYEKMEDQLSPICFSRLSLASLMAGDIKSSYKALSITDDILAKAPKSVNNSTHKNKGKLAEKNKTSSSLFERINRQEINEECNRVREYLGKLSESRMKSKILNMESSDRVYFYPETFKHLYPEIGDRDNPGLVQLRSLFHSYSKEGVHFNSNRQLKMEICSGHGHWITEKAAQESIDTDWISVEIRYDRIFQIWSKMVLESIDNLSIIGGEAYSSIKNTIPNDILDEVYINYPNPPVWEGAFRLINHDFLVDIHRCLKKDGTLTIVTDDKQYSEQIVETLKNSKILTKLFKPVKDHYICNLSEDYGYSYFNKLWNNGQRIKRYCIYIIK